MFILTLVCQLPSSKIGGAKRNYKNVQYTVHYLCLTLANVSLHSKAKGSCLYKQQVSLQASLISLVSTSKLALSLFNIAVFCSNPTNMNGMISFVCIAALVCTITNAAAFLPYGAYRGYYGLPFVPGVAPYAAPAVPAAPVAAAVPAAPAVPAPVAAPAVPAAVPAAPAVVPEYFSYPYGYPYFGAYGVYPYLKK
ncbi:hypothetical protein NPIL_4171 [Nephila pilipes]|uniref:Uncharacterized protein n=1 Tax=Nephila pilipes TaxID=299642 RepID=A0A8X6ISH1_NEPPI|nr:hypothetical protein NPIL_4171 [Nephila pilipes]